MRRLSYLIDGKADEHFERAFHLFGSDDPGGDSGGGAGEDIVTMGRGKPAQGGNVSAREEMAMNRLIDDMDMEDRMAGIYGMDDSAGDRMLVNRNIENPMTTGFGPSAANPDVPTNLFVGAPNLPPSVITGQRGERFDTQTGNIIQSDASYFGDLGGSSASMVPLNSAPVPTPPPPRFQTNAEKDFYENLAAQGDAAMNQFRAEVRNLDNRGLLGDFIARGIGNRGVPNFNPDMPPGYQIRGVTNTKFVDLPFVGTVPMSTYTGLDRNMPEDSDERAEEKPAVVMAEAPRCPEGYVFDEGLQACRLKTEGDADSSTASAAPNTGDIYYRETALDAAPANLPTDFDFDAANRRFIESYGYRPLFYQNPMDTTGFTKLV